MRCLTTRAYPLTGKAPDGRASAASGDAKSGTLAQRRQHTLRRHPPARSRSVNSQPSEWHRVVIRSLAALSLTGLSSCGDPYKSMESTALGLETLLGRLLLKSADAPWRYISRVMGTCSTALAPKYCAPIKLTGFRKLGWRPLSWQKYEATYAIHGGTTAQCETLGPRLAEIRADPHLVSGLRSREQLDTEHWKAHSKLSVGPELSQVPLQNEFFNPDNPRLYFIVELDLRKIETVEIDCAKRTITLLLAWP